MPGRLPGAQAGARLHRCVAPARSSPPAATRPPRPNTPPVATLADHGRAAAASTPTGSVRCPADERVGGSRALRPPGRRRGHRRRLPARSAQGVRHGDPGGRPAAVDPTRPRCSSSPGAAATRPAANGSRPNSMRRSDSSDGSRTTTCRCCTDVPTSSRCSAGTGGAGSNRRGSASCSSRPRRAGCRRWPATPVVPPKPSPTVRPASSSTTPTNVQSVVDAFARLLDDDELRRRMGERSRQRALDEFAYDVLARRLGETLGVYD